MPQFHLRHSLLVPLGDKDSPGTPKMSLSRPGSGVHHQETVAGGTVARRTRRFFREAQVSGRASALLGVPGSAWRTIGCRSRGSPHLLTYYWRGDGTSLTEPSGLSSARTHSQTKSRSRGSSRGMRRRRTRTRSPSRWTPFAWTRRCIRRSGSPRGTGGLGRDCRSTLGLGSLDPGGRTRRRRRRRLRRRGRLRRRQQHRRWDPNEGL